MKKVFFLICLLLMLAGKSFSQLPKYVYPSRVQHNDKGNEVVATKNAALLLTTGKKVDKEKSPLSSYINPLKSLTQAKDFYLGDSKNRSSVGLLSNFALLSDLNKTVIKSDLVSYIIPYANARLDLSTTVIQDNDSLQSEKAQNKLFYGGLLHLSLTYSLLYRGWDHAYVYVPVSASFNCDNVKGTQFLNDVFSFTEFGISLYGQIELVSSDGENASNGEAKTILFANTKMSFIDGNSIFYNNISNADPYINIRTGFWLGQFNAGLKFNGRLSVLINIPYCCSNKDILARKGGTIGITIDPNYFFHKVSR